MAATMEVGRPARQVKQVLEGLTLVESSRAIAGVVMPEGVAGKTLTLLGMDSKMLNGVFDFGRSLVSMGIGLGVTTKALGMMLRLI